LYRAYGDCSDQSENIAELEVRKVTLKQGIDFDAHSKNKKLLKEKFN
jgi:hypothetical protein